MTQPNLSPAVTAVPAAPPRRRPGPRRIAFTALAGLLSVVLTVLTGHLLVTGWFDGSDGGARRFDNIAWGAVEGVLVAVGLLAQLRRPERHLAGLRQALLGLLALIIAGALTGLFDPATAVVVLLIVLLAVLHPARDRVLRLGGVDPVVLPVALVIAGGMAWWATSTVHRFAALPGENVHVQHQDVAGLVGLAVGVALVALLAAVDRRSLLPGICAGIALVLVGVASLVLPGQADAFPGPGAVAALVGGVLLALLVGRRARR